MSRRTSREYSRVDKSVILYGALVSAGEGYRADRCERALHESLTGFSDAEMHEYATRTMKMDADREARELARMDRAEARAQEAKP